MLWQFLREGHGPHPGLAYKAGMGRKAKIDSKLDKVMCLPERRMGRFLYSSMMRCVAGVFGPLGLALLLVLGRKQWNGQCHHYLSFTRSADKSWEHPCHV